MAVESASMAQYSDVRPLLDSSPVSLGLIEPTAAPPELHRHIRWCSVEALEIPLQPDCSRAAAAGDGPVKLGLSSAMSTDSGCESEGSCDPESVYSTVTSCASDLVRMQLKGDDLQEESEEAAMAGSASAASSACSPSAAAELQLVEASVHLPPPPSPQESQQAEEFRSRSWSLDPKLHGRGCGAEDTGSIGPADDLQATTSCSTGQHPLRQARSEPSLSTSASMASMPICRICHMPSEEEADLISPCRCAGTMRYIHASCLMHWIEVSGRRNKRPPICELCQFQYHRHKRFRVGHWLLPRTSTRDKILHVVFVLMLVVMVVCGVVTIFCFKQDSGKRRTTLNASELTSNEVVTLVCGVLFFGAFFVAMYAEVKARHSLYELVSRFVRMNQQWYIDQYDREKDEKFRVADDQRAFAV